MIHHPQPDASLDEGELGRCDAPNVVRFNEVDTKSCRTIVVTLSLQLEDCHV